jgi:hypothetical protein
VYHQAVGTPDPYVPPRSRATTKPERASPFVSPGLLAQFAFGLHAVAFIVGFFVLSPKVSTVARGTQLVGFIALFMWLHSAAVLVRRKLALSPGWTIGVFFIPIVNLILPFRATAQIARAADPTRAAPVSISLWWGTCLSCMALAFGVLLHNAVAAILLIPLILATDILSIVMIHDVDERLANVRTSKRKRKSA